MSRIAVLRLSFLEVKKLLKSRSLYAILALLVLASGFSAIGQISRYNRERSYLENQLSKTLDNTEGGMFNPSYLPPGFDPKSRPLRDANFAIIPQNVEFYKSLYREYFTAKIDALNSTDGKYSLNRIIGNSASPVGMLLPLLAMVLAVGIFASEYHGGYRLIISRGVKRHELISAKIAAALGLAAVLASIFTVTLLIAGSFASSRIGGAGFAGLSLTQVAGIFGIAFLMLSAYMMLGGAISAFLASYISSMAVGMVLACISVVFFFTLTPEEDEFLARLSPISLGYNFNSLMYYLWRAGEAATRYRAAWASIAMAVIYSSAFVLALYTAFSKKDLKV